MSRRVGVFGGTFDPIHNGHLLLAEEARTALGLECVLFVPAGLPPHKQALPHTDPEQRVKMIELAIADNAGFRLSRIDVDRPGPHFSADMLRLMQAQWGADTELFFLMGLDSLANLLTWHEPATLLSLAQLVVAHRPSYVVDFQHILKALPTAEGRMHFIDMPLMEIAGADLRQRVRAGRSIRYLVPEPVRQYLSAQRLYQAS